MREEWKILLAILAVVVVGDARGQPKEIPDACKLVISSDDRMQFDKKELKAPSSCKSIELTLKHVGKLAVNVMGHNWVLTKAADVQPVASAGLKAGMKSDHVPAGDKRVIAATKLIGGGQSVVTVFSTAALKKGESYAYFCSFPGHSAIMKGKFIFG